MRFLGFGYANLMGLIGIVFIFKRIKITIKKTLKVHLYTIFILSHSWAWILFVVYSYFHVLFIEKMTTTLKTL